MMCGQCAAQPKTATVSGPASAPVGTIVELVAASDVASSMIWTTASTDASYRTYEGGKVLVFASPRPGRYEFVLVVVVVTADNKPLVSFEKHQVEITGGPAPPPGPNPPSPPNPGPTPPNPPNPPAPDRWGLSKLARETAPNRPDEKAKVRANYQLVSSGLAAATIRSVTDAKLRLSELNRAAVGNPAEQDHPWSKYAFAIGEKMAALRMSGELQETTADYSQAYSDIARGLE